MSDVQLTKEEMLTKATNVTVKIANIINTYDGTTTLLGTAKEVNDKGQIYFFFKLGTHRNFLPNKVTYELVFSLENRNGAHICAKLNVLPTTSNVRTGNEPQIKKDIIIALSTDDWIKTKLIAGVPSESILRTFQTSTA